MKDSTRLALAIFGAEHLIDQMDKRIDDLEATIAIILDDPRTTIAQADVIRAHIAAHTEVK